MKSGDGSSKRGAAPSTKSSTVDSASGPALREFLYLDYPKLSSYFAQLHRGLTTEIQSSHGRNDRSTVTGPSADASLDFGGSAGLEDDAATIQALLARLLGVTLRLDAKLSGAVHTEGEQQQLEEERREVATIRLHHAAFSMVESRLRSTGYVTDDPAAAVGRFITFSGGADLIDFDNLVASIRDFPKMGASFKKVTGQEDFSKHVKTPTELAFLIEKFYAGRIGLLVSAQKQSVSAYLSRDHLTAPIEFILDNYGRHSQIPVTVLGLGIGSAYPLDEMRGEMSFVEGIDETLPNEGTMMAATLGANRGLEGLDRFFRVRGAAHVYPLAVYVDLVPTNGQGRIS